LALLREFRTLDPRIWTLAVARLIVTFGFSTVMPFLAFQLSKQPGTSAAAIGSIWTISGVAGMVAQWGAGGLADRLGRRRLILGTLLVRAANLALLGLAIARHQPLAVVGALCVANGVLRGFFDPVASAMTADLSTGEQRVAAFSLQRVGLNIGWAAGPAVGALAQRLGVSYAQLFYLAAPVTLVSALALARIPETRAAVAATRTRFADLFHIPADPAFLRFLAATFTFFLLQVQLYQTLSVFSARALHLTRDQVGWFYSANGLLVVALQVPAFYYIRRIGTHRALVVGSMLYAAAYASCWLATGFWPLLASVAVITLAEMVSAPAQLTTSTSMAPPGRVGAYSGLYGLVQAAGQSLGPLIGGALFDRFGDRRIWLVLPLFGVLAAIGYRRSILPGPLGGSPDPPATGSDGRSPSPPTRPKLVAGQGALGRANK